MRNHSGVSRLRFGPHSIPCLHVAPISEFSVVLWWESAHAPLLLFAGWRGGVSAGFSFSVLPSQSASQLPTDASVSSPVPLWASTSFTPVLLLSCGSREKHGGAPSTLLSQNPSCYLSFEKRQALAFSGLSYSGFL